MTVKNEIDWYFLGYFFLFLLSIFSVLMIGLFASQAQSLGILERTFNDWATHLRESPDIKAVTGSAPFEELSQLEGAINSLHLQIESFKIRSAKDAKAKTQLSMLREIAHDLRTPVSQVAKYFSTLVSKAQRTGSIDPDLVAHVQRSIVRVGDLIRQVEAIKPQLKKVGHEKSGTDLALEVTAYAEDIRLESDVFVVVTVDINPTISAAIPNLQFYRLLDNLVRNARDAVDPKNGKIMISVSESDGHPALSVRDNGCGISESDLTVIFDAEFTTKQARGTGLGLSIVKKLCDDYSAKIQVTSKVGLGSEFRVLFQSFSSDRFSSMELPV